ncbi:MAG TPA: flagellar motor protein MotB [Ideonella sp.]|nr:flagellar motor protein MotB [Ideonella sp.]
MSKPDAHGATVVKRVSGKAHDDAHGGAWKVAFADFCLALLCLFLVLWLMAARDQEKTAEALRTATGSPFDEGGRGRVPTLEGSSAGSLISREPVPSRGDDPSSRGGQLNGRDVGEGGGPTPRLAKTRYESEADLKELAQTLERISAESGLARNVEAAITPYGLRVMLHDTDKEGMFKRGNAIPTERFRALLHRLGPLFAQIENQLLVVGHTDAMQYADRSPLAFSNWALSNERAMSARAQLLVGGMPVKSVLQVVGMADRAPLDTQNPRADVNRRIELMVLTPAQSRNLSAMFGIPGATQPLTDDSSSAARAGDATVAALRDQLLSKKDEAPRVR